MDAERADSLSWKLATNVDETFARLTTLAESHKWLLSRRDDRFELAERNGSRSSKRLVRGQVRALSDGSAIDAGPSSFTHALIAMTLMALAFVGVVYAGHHYHRGPLQGIGWSSLLTMVVLATFWMGMMMVYRGEQRDALRLVRDALADVRQ